MSSLGPYLRDLRERHGASLEEISRATRVGRSHLEALESSDFARLPAPTFTRGFIRAYCQALDERPDEALRHYDSREAVSTDAAPVPATPARRPRARADAAARARSTLIVSFVLLVVLGASLFAVALVLQSGREADRQMAAEPGAPDGTSAGGHDVLTSAASSASAEPVPAPSPAGASAAPVPVPVAPGAASAAATPAPAEPARAERAVALPPAVAAGGTSAPPAIDLRTLIGNATVPYRLVARTTEATWMRVRTADGRQSEETIPAGQVREWVSNERFTVTIGNAAGVRLELNGTALPPLGPHGSVIQRLVLPPEAS
jgi:cytoskeletal protein RodZ